MGEAYTPLQPMQFFGSWKGIGWSRRKVGKKDYLLKGCCRGVFINSSEMVGFLQEKCKNHSNPEYSFKEIDCC